MHSKHRSRMSYMGPFILAFLGMLGSMLMREEEKAFLSNGRIRKGGFKMQSKHRSRMSYMGPVVLAFFGMLGFILDASGFASGFFARFHWQFGALGAIGVCAVWSQHARERRQLQSVEERRRRDRMTRTFRNFSKLGIVVSRNKNENRKGPAAQMQAGQGGL